MYCVDIYSRGDCYKVFTDKNGEKSNLWWTHTIDETNQVAKKEEMF